ncbi:MAG: pyridoxamine 5'-phosphate oxidase family protein [Microbacterium sp.]
MSFDFDPENEVHLRSLARLESEQVVWLVTSGRDGYPHAVPVWFLWLDGKAVIFSEPKTAKVANIRADDKVALHLEAGADGEQLTVLRGTAVLHDDAPQWVPDIGDDYTAKYDEWLERLELTTASMLDKYTTVIEFTPDKLIAW